MNGFPILSLITFLPIIGMVIILFLKKEQATLIKYVTLAATGVQLLLSLILLSNFNYSAAGVFDQNSFQFIEKFRWIEIPGVSFLGTVKIDYFLGIDGLSMPW